MEIVPVDYEPSWNKQSCPVCFYIKNPDLLKNFACMACNIKSNLWLCITCCHIGCVDNRDAIQHYNETKHACVLQLEGFKVWDISLSQYLHKLDANIFHPYIQTNAAHTCLCVVCQYKKAPKLIKQPSCMMCNEFRIEKLWICLTCSHIGCSINGHGLLHYNKTKHSYVMQMEDFSVWDYNKKKYLHSQLHKTGAAEMRVIIIQSKERKETVSTRPKIANSLVNILSKSSLLKEQQLRDDFERRLICVERQCQEFAKLTKVNETMIIIEKRLLNLTQEKNILEDKLHEHDTKLNELLAQLSGNRGNNVPAKHVESDEIKIVEHGLLLKVLDTDEDVVKTSPLKDNKIISPTQTSTSSNQTEFASLIIVGLMIHFLLRLSLQKMFEHFTNLFEF